MRFCIFFAFVCSFSILTLANAQETDFFWSDSDLNKGAKNGPTVLSLNSAGDSGAIFLYYSTNGPTGFDLDVGAFLFGRVDFEVVGQGCVQIHIGRGQKGIGRRINQEFSWNELFEPTFGSDLITVGSIVRGDLDDDGLVTLTDVAPFVQELTDNEYSLEADTNCDGQLSLLDVTPFVDLLSGNGNTYTVIDPSVENNQPKFDMLGDTTDDGIIDMLDVACFRQIGNDCGAFANTDINGDGTINLLDLCPFVEVILNHANK